MILWVDDNDELRRAVAEHLRAAGHRVLEAADAGEAVERLGSERPRLLLTDLRLPGATGLELAESLRSRPGLAALPVVLVTSHAADHELAAWHDDPAFVRLQKPFDLGALTAAVEALLEGKRPLEEPQSATRVAVGSGPAQTGSSQARSSQTRSSQTRPSSRRRSPRPWLRPALAACVAVAALGVVGSLWLAPGVSPWVLSSRVPGTGPPALPDAPSDDVRRRGVVETLDPYGPLAAPPQSFRWRPDPRAARYRLEISDVAGDRLWQGETAGTDLPLPKELEGRLLPLAAYYWRVEALDDAGRTVAGSEPVRFRIVASDITSDVTSDATSDVTSDAGETPP